MSFNARKSVYRISVHARLNLPAHLELRLESTGQFLNTMIGVLKTGPCYQCVAL